MPTFPQQRRALVRALGSIGLLTGVRVRANETSPNPVYAQPFAGLDQAQVTLQRWLGQPLVLNFWATWCAPCVTEMPDLDALHRAYPQVGFVGLAVDTAANVHRFVKQVPVSYPLLIGGHGSIEHMRALGNRKGGLPFTVVFDAQGRVQQQILGPIQPATLATRLRTLSA